jgi:hypothetical protein
MKHPLGKCADAPLSEAAPQEKKKGSMAVIGAFRGEFPAGIAGKTIVVVDGANTVILLLQIQ